MENNNRRLLGDLEIAHCMLAGAIGYLNVIKRDWSDDRSAVIFSPSEKIFIVETKDRLVDLLCDVEYRIEFLESSLDA